MSYLGLTAWAALGACRKGELQAAACIGAQSSVSSTSTSTAPETIAKQTCWGQQPTLMPSPGTLCGVPSRRGRVPRAPLLMDHPRLPHPRVPWLDRIGAHELYWSHWHNSASLALNIRAHPRPHPARRLHPVTHLLPHVARRLLQALLARRASRGPRRAADG